jgi:hypothetical protein
MRIAFHLPRNRTIVSDYRSAKDMKATAEWINGQVLIPDLLRAAPQARAVLDRYGLRGCGGPPF